jgi:hypothetical protein
LTKEETLQFIKLVNANFPKSFDHLKGDDNSRNMIASQWYIGFQDYTPQEVMKAFQECLSEGLGNYQPSLGEIYGKLLDKLDTNELLGNNKQIGTWSPQVKQIGTEPSYDPRMWSEGHPHPTYDPELQKECEEMLERILKEGVVC